MRAFGPGGSAERDLELMEAQKQTAKSQIILQCDGPHTHTHCYLRRFPGIFRNILLSYPDPTADHILPFWKCKISLLPDRGRSGYKERNNRNEPEKAE